MQYSHRPDRTVVALPRREHGQRARADEVEPRVPTRRCGEQAADQIGADLVAPSPPGIPVLAPGQEITARTLATLKQAAATGVRIADAADPSLATLRVVRP